MLSQDFKEFVKLLNEKEVEYLLVGGYAVGIHGRPRYTGDMDIWINNSAQNAEKMMYVINDFGFSSLGLEKSDFQKKGNIIQMGHPPLRIDILNDIDGVNFDDCYAQRGQYEVGDIMINVIALVDLIKNKKASGRLRDLDDLENLK